ESAVPAGLPNDATAGPGNGAGGAVPLLGPGVRPIDAAAAPAPAAALRKHRAIALGWWHGTSDNLRSSIILLIALVAFTAMVVLIKVAGKRIPLVEILTVRQLVMQVLVASVVRVGFRQALRTRYPMLQI